jgi:hypothetical protein
MSGTELANYDAARRFLAEACLRLIRKYFKMYRASSLRAEFPLLSNHAYPVKKLHLR